MADSNHDGVRPKWVSNELYPFTSRFFDAPRGRIHYIDEGQGAPLVFIHGNPSWSFEYRHLIKAFRDSYRCVALDHLGFGLSDRSQNYKNYHPAAHAETVAALMDHLKLDKMTLVFSDWGGPIALDFARKNPDRVAGIVIMNSWCWPVNWDLHFLQFSLFMSSLLGQFLIRRFNFFVNKVMPKAVGNPMVLTDEIMSHYRNAQPTATARSASAAFPGYITGATRWLTEIWNDRAAFTNKPALVLWGLKDIAFRRKELETWKSELKNHIAQEFPECGHFPAEEDPQAVITHIRSFLEANTNHSQKPI